MRLKFPISFPNGTISSRSMNRSYYLRKPPPGGWKSNIRGGGQVVHTVLTRSEAELALAIAPRAGLDNVSLDIGEHEGKIYLIETNLNYGGIIDFDLDRGTCNVRYCAEYLLHLARYGRHALLERPTKGRSDISPRRMRPV